MNKKSNAFLKYQLAKKGLTVYRSTKVKVISQLIRKLYPYSTNHQLIRIGGNGDGGYLVPDDLQGINACFSPGVDTISDFELECIKRGMKVFMADKSVDWPNLEVDENLYSFIKKFIGILDDETYITMDTWVNTVSLPKNSDLILQMDIEGDEFQSLATMSDDLYRRFRIMVIEFHNLELLWNLDFYKRANTVFENILKNHICVHIHPNNCCGIDSRFGIDIPRVAEFTFIRKDRVAQKKYTSTFPHRLDYDNKDKKSIILPKNWYRSI